MLYLALCPAHACPDTAPTVTGRSAVIMHFTGNEGQAGTVTWEGQCIRCCCSSREEDFVLKASEAVQFSMGGAARGGA